MALAFLFVSCQKENALPGEPATIKPLSSISKSTTPALPSFTTYTIPEGAHYCDKSTFQQITVSELKFTVKFDSSAIYESTDPVDQYDINKLYGFSEYLPDNHINSARIGWNWRDGQLWLYPYTYVNGVTPIDPAPLATVPLNTEIECSIKLAPNQYVFTVNDNSVSVPRAGIDTVITASQLYPYFGGNEVAPHEIHLYIK